MGWEALGHTKKERAFPQTFLLSPPESELGGGEAKASNQTSPRNGPRRGSCLSRQRHKPERQGSSLRDGAGACLVDLSKKSVLSQ